MRQEILNIIVENNECLNKVSKDDSKTIHVICIHIVLDLESITIEMLTKPHILVC